MDKDKSPPIRDKNRAGMTKWAGKCFVLWNGAGDILDGDIDLQAG